MPGGVPTAELERGLDAGGQVLDAVVVFLDGTSREFVPFLRLSWRPDEFVSVSKYRRGGVRSFTDFSVLWQRLTGPWRYAGEVRVVGGKHPLVAELELFDP